MNLKKSFFGAWAIGGILMATMGVWGADSRPNIIVILADDLGFSDVGCYGGEIQTPNLDALAKEGVRFTQFYNCSRCSPTRASLLTGIYAHQANLAKNGRSLSLNAVTIAEVLKGAGYQTSMVGKWHLSVDKQLEKEEHLKWLNHQIDPGVPFSPIESYPVNRGFDKFYGVIWGVIDFFDPFSLVEGTKPVATVGKDFYFTDAISDKAVEYVREFSKEGKPFFMYFAECASHWPIHALPEDIAKYKGRYNEGWAALRKERFDRQVGLGLFDKGKLVLPPLDAKEDWDALSEEERRFQSSKMEVHAAMVDRMDQGIGKLVAALKETGQFDNTLIFFLSDNGASPEVPTFPPGYDRPSQTRDGRAMQRDDDLRLHPELIGSEESYTGIGEAWANAANTPYRFWKKESYEGGNHTPLIVHWPAGLKQKPGSFSPALGHVMDIMPTCLELAGAKYPAKFDGHEIVPMDGISLLPVFATGARQGHETIYFEHAKGRAVRSGDWKLVSNCDTPNQWSLYNLAKDPTETEDVSDQYPEKKEFMITGWNQWYKTMPK
ncbi:MAG: arylsulfatase [Kiritimatiellales bacterium]|nr:arylsulfatase [Kiritimatiellales bacterium]